jgi:Fe-S-cluster containining protein
MALQAVVDTMGHRGDPTPLVVDHLASGAAAQAIGHVALQPLVPKGLACAKGCAFCCILSGADGGTISEAEARALHEALSPLAGKPDGRAWQPQACPALDPETRICRAYEARPMICRSYVSTDAGACEEVSNGRAAPGPGTLGPYHTYLAALGLSRATLKGTRRVATYALARVAAAAVAGKSCEESLDAARHKPAELEAELRRSKRDLARATPAGLP